MSIFGSLLFNISLANIFFVIKDRDIGSYAGDSTRFIAGKNLNNVIAFLEQVSDAFFNWFNNNRLKSNVDKNYLLLSTNKPVGIKIGEYILYHTKC